MPCLARAAAALLGMAASAGGTGGDNLANVLFYGDIGKTREDRDYLTSPWPMGKCSEEGAFSLYEGLYEYVTKQGARAKDALILGDVGYVGGDATGLGQVRLAHQKYLAGMVPPDRVFPVIGNHDIHYLGCTYIEKLHVIHENVCNYGSKTGHAFAEFFSQHQMSYDAWRGNWLESFPGLLKHAVAPVRRTNRRSLNVTGWPAPMRYNIDPGNESRVYIIVGLITGSQQTRWQDDTPIGGLDGMVGPNKSRPRSLSVECAFLRDSLEHGRRLGKSIFIYATHHFNQACTVWSLIRQVDVWMHGHKHTYWQSAAHGGRVVQEQRHYPTRLLIGNGGFDEANINVVSFGHLREEVFESEGGPRVRLHFDIRDTCVVSNASCPIKDVDDPDPFASCWKNCTAVPGGYDGGGGPRGATPSAHGFGFTFEAPLRPAPVPPQAPLGGSWKIRLGAGNASSWLALGPCGSGSPAPSGCVVSEPDADNAAVFTLYDSSNDTAGRTVSVRLAVENARRGPVVRQPTTNMLWQDRGFWDTNSAGFGLMLPSDGFLFGFAEDGEGWRALGVEWDYDEGAGVASLVVAHGVGLAAGFHAAEAPHMTPPRGAGRGAASEIVV